MTETERVIFAAGSGQLDRATHLRDIAGDLMRHRRAALLPLFQERVLIDLSGASPRLGWVPPMQDYVALATEPPVFLGLSSETPCFAGDFSALLPEEAEDRFCDRAEFMDLRSIAGDLGPASAAIAAAAKGLLGWHLSHPFCARCGHPTLIEEGGWKRRCDGCGGAHFPRTDPVAIMLILRDDNVLLARQPEWAPGRYSLLAGFIEPGETLADAIRRQSFEEAGIRVGEVRYLGCQPWPFPSNLMLGCAGKAEMAEITLDPEKLEDAQWVSRAKMEIILDGRHPRIDPPPADGLARAILADWVSGAIGGF